MKRVGKKPKKGCRILNYTEHLLILASTVTGCLSISILASFIAIIVGITSFAAAIKMCVITARIQIYKSIIEKEEKT